MKRNLCGDLDGIGKGGSVKNALQSIEFFEVGWQGKKCSKFFNKKYKNEAQKIIIYFPITHPNVKFKIGINRSELSLESERLYPKPTFELILILLL